MCKCMLCTEGKPLPCLPLRHIDKNKAKENVANIAKPVAASAAPATVKKASDSMEMGAIAGLESERGVACESCSA